MFMTMEYHYHRNDVGIWIPILMYTKAHVWRFRAAISTREHAIANTDHVECVAEAVIIIPQLKTQPITNTHKQRKENQMGKIDKYEYAYAHSLTSLS